MSYSNLIARLEHILNRFVVVLLVLLVLDVSWQVITRFVLDQPSSFTEEIARFLLIWITLLGAVIAYRYKDHLGFDLVVKKLPVGLQSRVTKFNSILTLIFAFFILLLGGGNLVYIVFSLEQFSSVLNINMAFIYAVIPLSGALFSLFAIDNLVTPRTSSLSPGTSNK